MIKRPPAPDMVEALALIERVGGPDLVTKIVTMFAQTARERVQRFPGLREADDRIQLSRLAHALKGSAAQVGATSLRDLAAALEHDAVALERGELSARLDGIAAATEHAIESLQELAQGAGS